MRLEKVLIALIVLACFVPLFLFRELPIGSDSIYYLGQACNTTPSINTGIWENVVVLFPCNVLFLKFFMLFIALLSAWGLYQIANNLFPEGTQNWLIVLFAFGLTFLPTFFLQSENDQVGLMFGIWATVLFLKNKTAKYYSLQKDILAVGILVLGIFVWKAIALLLIFWIFYDGFFIISIFPLAFFLLKEISPNNIVAEHISLYGFYMIGASIFYFWQPLKNKKLFIIFMFYFLLAIIKLNMWVFAALIAPFIVLQSFYATKPQYKWLFFVGLLAFSIVLFNNIINAYPNSNDITITQQAISISPDLNSEWSNAWLVYYFGGNPNTFNYPTLDNNIFLKKGLVLSYYLLPNCQIVLCQYETVLCRVASEKTKLLKLQKCM